jgi:hypothetical protein
VRHPQSPLAVCRMHIYPFGRGRGMCRPSRWFIACASTPTAALHLEQLHHVCCMHKCRQSRVTPADIPHCISHVEVRRILQLNTMNIFKNIVMVCGIRKHSHYCTGCAGNRGWQLGPRGGSGLFGPLPGPSGGVFGVHSTTYRCELD